MPPVTATLITLNVAAYLVSLALPRLVVSFALWPIGGEWLFLSKVGPSAVACVLILAATKAVGASA